MYIRRVPKCCQKLLWSSSSCSNPEASVTVGSDFRSTIHNIISLHFIMVVGLHSKSTAHVHSSKVQDPCVYPTRKPDPSIDPNRPGSLPLRATSSPAHLCFFRSSCDTCHFGLLTSSTDVALTCMLTWRLVGPFPMFFSILFSILASVFPNSAPILLFYTFWCSCARFSTVSSVFPWEFRLHIFDSFASFSSVANLS
ncbi:hypothetical protein PIB30_063980 [Stylosanthes scabra]|uniref:Uncharacterized protein n=1 Tax=Stylosanthes scabra TaxID=79078 RepID=A0ABU6RLQ7_9FABA|nr:hypothetical protein [Stylosanthes scabra]